MDEEDGIGPVALHYRQFLTEGHRHEPFPLELISWGTVSVDFLHKLKPGVIAVMVWWTNRLIRTSPSGLSAMTANIASHRQFRSVASVLIRGLGYRSSDLKQAFITIEGAAAVVIEQGRLLD